MLGAGAMLEGLLWTALALIGLVLAALAVPIDVMARIDFDGRTHGWVRIGWLFGLVRLRTDIGAKTPKARKKPKASKRRRRAGRASPAVMRRGFAVLGELLRRVRIRRVELDLSVGTDDPAATGELVGYVAPVVALANALPRTRVSLRPDFGGPAFAGAGLGEIRVVPIRLVAPVLGLAVSPEVRKWLFARR